VQITVPVDMDLDIRLVNLLGETKLWLKEVKLDKGNNSIVLEVQNIPNGAYTLLLSKERPIANKTIMIKR
jgi:hypothetical protein